MQRNVAIQSIAHQLNINVSVEDTRQKRKGNHEYD